jgi:AhpD family alkylhydroperoxidase
MAADGFFKAIKSSFGARLAMAALNYGLFLVLSHRLDSAGLGGYSVLMNLFFLLQALPLLGLIPPMARRIASEPGAMPTEISNSLVFALPVSVVIGAGLAGAGALWYAPSLQPAFVLVGMAMLPTAWTVVVETALLGRERMSLVARVQCIEALGRMLCAVAVVSLGQGLTGVFGVFLAWRCVAAALYLRHAEVPLPQLALVTRALCRRNLAEVPTFLVIAIVAAVVTRCDVVVLGHLAGLRAAGVYAAAARLYEASLMLPTIGAMIMLPALARLFVQDQAGFSAMLVKSLRLSLGLGFVPALAVAALAEPLVHLLYSAPLYDAAPVLRLLIIGAVLTTVDQLLSSTMTAAHAQRHDLHAMLVGLVVLTAGLCALVPPLGPLGAAVAVPAALGLRVLWRLRWAARTIDLPGLWSSVGRLMLAWLAAGLALAAGLLVSPWAALAAAWLVYALALRATGLVTRWPSLPAKLTARPSRAPGSPS